MTEEGLESLAADIAAVALVGSPIGLSATLVDLWAPVGARSRVETLIQEGACDVQTVERH
eukprot:3806517-Pyramimonas_sp.AAC.1